MVLSISYLKITTSLLAIMLWSSQGDVRSNGVGASVRCVSDKHLVVELERGEGAFGGTMNERVREIKI
jgi:hypothetical protein